MKMSLILLVTLAVTTLLRRRSAAVRHWVLAAGIACAAATPLLEIVVPVWGVSPLDPSITPLVLEESTIDRTAAVQRVNPDLALAVRAALWLRPVWLLSRTSSRTSVAATGRCRWRRS
jgi:hypothetical protein